MNYFYKTGVDITNDKQMFNFLKGHFRYATMNSWNGVYSIANNVKVHRLNLSGDCWTALNLLQEGEYDTLCCVMDDWRRRNYPSYEVGFNGRSGGYLVLKSVKHNDNVLPDFITDCDTYEDYKEYCKEYYGSVKANRSDLVYYTKLVQDFDKLCDQLRDYCDELSNLKFEVVEMEKTVEDFNNNYADDLELLGFDELSCDGFGKVDCSEIRTLQCLFEAFLRLAARPNSSYLVKWTDEGVVYYEEL